MANLLTLDRTAEIMSSLPSCDEIMVKHLISGVSDTITTYLGRNLASATYDELYHGTNKPLLLLNQFPVTEVLAVRFGVAPAVYVQNNDSTNYAATVETTATGITLRRMKNGGMTTNVLLFATYTTCGALGDAVNALANGWQATVTSDFAGWVSTDLAILKGTRGARLKVAHLSVHRWYLSDYKVSEAIGELYTPCGFGGGYENYRVNYVAGYATVPDAVQEAAAFLVKSAYQYAQTINGNLQSETLGQYSYTRGTVGNAIMSAFDAMPTALRLGLMQYKDYSIPRYKA